MASLAADVAIIGAGPGGSTCGAFLRKYRPDLKVVLLERATFPRDHVGESQLPLLSQVLSELGVWDRVEAANFPIKIGATYRWGKSADLWDFDFLPSKRFRDEPRPGRYQGQRSFTAFQVDRSVYDKILSDYAQELGCEIRFGCAVRSIEREGDWVTRLMLAGGDSVEAGTYVDASGHSGILRRAMGVEIETPTSLQNIAIWSYWRNAAWADEIGIGGTRVQVLSLGYGWVWFIPLGPDRTSIGLVCPAEYYKQAGKTPAELYEKALSEEERVSELLVGAASEGNLSTTKDWSFVANRMAGENWLLVGESMGFADPILAAGLTITQVAAREAAFLILEQARGSDPSWLREQYEAKNRRRLHQHIRFADYWYTANAHFSELKDFTSKIAAEAGLELSADKAFQWLGTGGFVEEDMNTGGIGTYRIDLIHQIGQRLSDRSAPSAIDGKSFFILKTEGAEVVHSAAFRQGRVLPTVGLSRDGKYLPLDGIFGPLLEAMKDAHTIDEITGKYLAICRSQSLQITDGVERKLLHCLEALVQDGWVKAKTVESLPSVRYDLPFEGATVRTHGKPD